MAQQVSKRSKIWLGGEWDRITLFSTRPKINITPGGIITLIVGNCQAGPRVWPTCSFYMPPQSCAVLTPRSNHLACLITSRPRAAWIHLEAQSSCRRRNLRQRANLPSPDPRRYPRRMMSRRVSGYLSSVGESALSWSQTQMPHRD